MYENRVRFIFREITFLNIYQAIHRVNTRYNVKKIYV